MTVTPVGSEFQVNTFTTGTQFGSSVAVEADGDGDFIVTWSSNGQDGDDFGVFAQRYNADGTTEGNEFQVNTYTTNSQDISVVAVDGDGDFIITWSSDGQDGDERGIFAQRYNANGTPNGSEFQVNTFTTGTQSEPAVAVDGDGDFVITWWSRPSDGSDGNGGDIFAQRYNADGTTNGSEFQVNTFFTNGSQSEPAVAVDEDGDFIIIWSNDGLDGNDNGVFAQRYNADGTTNGSEFQVNTNADHVNVTTGSPFASAVAVDDNGDFVITWSSSRSQAGGGSGVFARRYNADGTPNGSQFQVNDDGSEPAVAVNGDGDFIITWSGSQDGDGSGVFAQYYNADGTPNGSEFQVNTFTTDSQTGEAVAVDDNGDFVITWNSVGQEGDDDPGNIGIFAQRFTVTDEAENTSPTISFDATVSILENGLATLTGTITDPDVSDTFTLVLDWGDSLSPNNTETFNFDSSVTGSQNFSIEHQYLDDNPSNTASDTYTIQAIVTDNNQETGEDFQELTVNNVAPSLGKLTVTSVFINDEDGEDGEDGESLSITIEGTFTDPGSLDLHNGMATWSDGFSGGFEDIALGDRSFIVTRFLSEEQLEDNFPEVDDDTVRIGVDISLFDDDLGTDTTTFEFNVSTDD